MAALDQVSELPATISLYIFFVFSVLKSNRFLFFLSFFLLSFFFFLLVLGMDRDLRQGTRVWVPDAVRVWQGAVVLRTPASPADPLQVETEVLKKLEGEEEDEDDDDEEEEEEEER